MYAVLKGVPEKIRRAAYQRFIEASPPTKGMAFAPNGEERYWRRIDGNNYCPLGVVSLLVTGETPSWTLPSCAGDLAWDTSNEAVERFIHDNDNGKFDTPEKLARAMGVTV